MLNIGVEIDLELFNKTISHLLEKNALNLMSLLNIKPESPEEFEMMQGDKIKPLKPIVMKVIDVLSLFFKIEGLKKIETLICESDVFSFLWVLFLI